MTTKNNKGKYWYSTYTQYCPICGSGDSVRGRMYTPKPDKWEDRNEEVEVYDYCNELII